MRTLIVFALVGLGAQLVDGALGMAYGVTSTSLLLVAGVNPATASASVRPRRARHHRRGRRLALALRQRRLEAGAAPGCPGRGRRIPRRHRPVVRVDRRRRSLHGRRAAGAGRLHPAEVRAPPAEGGDRAGVAARVQALVPAGVRRGVRRRVRWRRVGPGGHARVADRGQDRTADDHRVGRHVRVPRRAGGECRLPRRAGKRDPRPGDRRRPPPRRRRSGALRCLAGHQDPRTGARQCRRRHHRAHQHADRPAGARRHRLGAHDDLRIRRRRVGGPRQHSPSLVTAAVHGRLPGDGSTEQPTSAVASETRR